MANTCVQHSLNIGFYTEYENFSLVKVSTQLVMKHLINICYLKEISNEDFLLQNDDEQIFVECLLWAIYGVRYSEASG